MKKFGVTLALVLLVVPMTLGARNLFSMRLGFTGIYVEPTVVLTQDEKTGFFENMGSGANWGFGGELSMRLSIVKLSTTLASTQLHEQQVSGAPVGVQTLSGMRLLTTLGFSIPIVDKYIDLDIGVGMGLRFMFPKAGDTLCVFPDFATGGYVAVPISGTSFSEVMMKSPWHLRVGIDFMFGPFGINVFYIMESKATIAGFSENGGWMRMFQQNVGSLGVGVNLSLF